MDSQFPKAVVTNHLKLVASHNKLLFSQFWRPEIHTQGVSRSAFPSESTGKDPGLLLPVLVVPGVSCLTAASLQSLPMSSHGLLLSAILLEEHWSQDLGTTRITQDDLISRSLMTIHLQRPFIQIRWLSQVPSIRSWTDLLGASPFSPLQGTNEREK